MLCNEAPFSAILSRPFHDPKHFNNGECLVLVGDLLPSARRRRRRHRSFPRWKRGKTKAKQADGKRR